MGWTCRTSIALLFMIVCECHRDEAPAEDESLRRVIEISVRARSGGAWASMLTGGVLSLKVPPNPAAVDLTVDLDAYVSVRSEGTGVVVHTDRRGSNSLTVALDGTDIASCSPPCSVRLKDVPAGEHIITASAIGSWQNLTVRPCRFRLSQQGESSASIYSVSESSSAPGTSATAEHGSESTDLKLTDGIKATTDADAQNITSSGGMILNHITDGRYVAVLFPLDDTCLTDSHNAYVSLTVTDGFFKLPRTRSILARFETTVHCIIGNDEMVLPAPMNYNPKTQGALVQCHSYESDFALTDGYVKRIDGSLAGVPGMGQHDCPAGTICKHDLEDGFMIDVWLVVPEAGQTLQSDLAEGMHVARFFIIDAETRQQIGHEATVTFFVDHGSGRVCTQVPSTPPLGVTLDAALGGGGLNKAAAAAGRGGDGGGGGDGDASRSGQKRRLVNVARQGRAVQSSTEDGREARLAIDGSLTVGAAGPPKGSAHRRPEGLSSRTMAELSPFWEVELPVPSQLQGITIWVDLGSSGASGYPPFHVRTPLTPLRMLLLDVERDIVAERVVDATHASSEVLLWEDLERLLGVGVRVHTVRLQVETELAEAGEGRWEDSDGLRQLALREVQVWAWVADEEAGAAGGSMQWWRGCKVNDDCVYGRCVVSGNTAEGRVEMGGAGGEEQSAAEQGVCVCDANWFGTHCDYNILQSSQYLPPLLSDREFPGAGGHAEEAQGNAHGGASARTGMAKRRGCIYQGCEVEDKMVESSLLDLTINEIATVQGVGADEEAAGAGGGTHVPQDWCASEHAISFFFENRGLAATMLHIAGLLGFAFSQRRALVLSKTHPWVYTDAASCPQRDLQCYFEAWSRCQEAGNGSVAEGSFLAGGRDNLVRDFNWAVPAAVSHKGVFWWRLACVSMLWRVRGSIARELAVEEVKKKIGFEHPIIAMHVRRGDSCHTSLRRNRCLTLAENLRGVEAMAARYNTSRVFLATDSPTAKKELEGLAPHLQFVSISSFDRSSLEESIHHCAKKHPGKTDDGLTLEDGCTGNDAWLEHRLGRGYVKQRELAVATILDLVLMSHADYFVGHFSSNLSRLAYLLAVGHHRRMIPYWSVDGPWCYHWRMCCDINMDGSSRVC